MRVVLDTNVFVSAVFFGGVPGRILEAWRDARIQLVLSPEIFEEYQRVGQHLRAKHPDVGLDPFLLACAAAAGVVVVISGDKDLLEQSGWRDVQVVRPRRFMEEFLPEPQG